MLKENISLSQLTAIIIGFDLGSSLVIVMGLNAKEDAWIVVLLSSFIGVILSLFFFSINEHAPGKNLFEIFEFCFNRPIAIFLSILYLIYFLYISCRIVRDFGELSTTFILPVTPIEIIIFSLVMVIGYILYLGLEVLARTTEIFTPYSFLFLLLLVVALLASGHLSITKALPMLAKGIYPITTSLFPYEINRPWGELVVFTCIFPYLTRFKESKGFVILSVVISGLLLTLATFIITVSLGPTMASRASFPLLSATRLISLADFIERIDALALFIITLGIIVKGSIFTFAALKGLEYIFRIPYRYFVGPVICTISMFAVFISKSYIDHINEAFYVIPFLIHMPLQFIIPSFLLFLLLLKKLRNTQQAKKMG